MKNASLYDDILDLIIKDSLTGIEENRQDNIENIVKTQPVFTTSLQFKHNMKKLLKTSNTKPQHSKITKLVTILAACLLFLTSLFVVAETNGFNLLELIFNIHDEYTEVNFIKNEDISAKLKDKMNYVYSPKLLPKSYKLDTITSTNTSCTMVFVNDEDRLEFIQDKLLPNGDYTLDTQDAKTDVVEINGLSGIFIKKNGKNFLYFYNNENFKFSLCSSVLNNLELVKIAENLVIKKI